MAAKAPFKLFSFFFSTRGRVSRVPFALFEIPVLLVFEAIGWIVVPQLIERYGVRDGSWMTVNFVAGIANVLLLWPRFAVAVKRLHDVNWPWWPALPVLAPLVLGLIGGLIGYFDAANSFPTKGSLRNGVDWVRNGLALYGAALTLLLAFVPGTKCDNRFGTDPRRPETAADQF